MLRFLLDEHLRGPLWLALVRHNLRGGLPVDVVRVGDPADLPLGSDDAIILRWTEREGRILLTEDVHTMPGHLARHLQATHHSPGILVVRTDCSIGQLVSSLEVIAHAAEPEEFEDSISYLP